jgi:hypothetical protein
MLSNQKIGKFSLRHDWYAAWVERAVWRTNHIGEAIKLYYSVILVCN